MAYFDQFGDASDEAGRCSNFSELPALNLVSAIPEDRARNSPVSGLSDSSLF
jgi:hypothetical protein